MFLFAVAAALSISSVAYAATPIEQDKSFNPNTDYYISPVAGSGFVLDASGAKPRKGSNVSVWTRNNGANQKWRLVLGSDGYYTIKNAANQTLYLDAAGKSPRQGSNASTWSDTKGLNQK